jgi:mono/diheme cytochrome c family protein
MPRKLAMFLVMFFVCLAVSPLTARAAEPAKDPPVDFSRDIKPILSNNCYACHGPDEGKRKGKLRLDLREEAIKSAIKPGDPAGSPLVERIVTKDPHEIMPPPSTKKPPLNGQQIDLVRKWIAQGAKFDMHWAYVKPISPARPQAPNAAWVKNPIDQFVATEHARHRFTPATEADRITLIRRLYFDLIGLPPTLDELNAAMNDTSADWYDKLVDRLLANKHFGERMAIFWLDLVRFADTCGYHSDNHRDIYLYRDYVIAAFNANKPFDRFTLEQLAGDLLAPSSDETRIASGYNRVLMTTEEGGAQAKEYVAKYAADRVRNVSVVWLATTMGCSECHNHKFDPFTMRDFYSLASFFADIKETAVGRQAQDKLPSPEQARKLAELDRKIAESQQQLKAVETNVDRAVFAGAVASLQNNLNSLALISLKKLPPAKPNAPPNFLASLPMVAGKRKQATDLQQEKLAFEKTIPTTLVSMSVNPRAMRILPRGNWLDDSGDIVQPAVPASLPLLDVQGRRANRLDLANWLVSRDNPLTARVFVNRLWKLTFGQGIVRSLEDFGTQGSMPTHRELLDWLATEFIESGWNVKHMMKLMVTSATYRQSSVGNNESRDRDPMNHWLARQNRFRIDAEMVRDNALAVSGLLSPKIGGASVKPYQPAGYWQFLNFPTRDWIADKGDDQYRRGLYTYWQRTFLHPSLLAFDAPTREECTAERPRSSTPLQALVLLNDPTYVEAARAFAERIMKEGGNDTAERLTWAYRAALSRSPRPEEVKILLTLYARHLDSYTADAAAAQKLVATGQKPVPQGMNVAELAAWTSVARVVLNLHETITRN